MRMNVRSGVLLHPAGSPASLHSTCRQNELQFEQESGVQKAMCFDNLCTALDEGVCLPKLDQHQLIQGETHAWALPSKQVHLMQSV